MKKIFYLFAAIGITWGIVSCDNEPKNPGDFNLKSELTLSDIVSNLTGDSYKLQESRVYDTVFQNFAIRKDTVFDVSGAIESIKNDTIWYNSKHLTRMHVMEPIILPSVADTFHIELQTNAKWMCPPPSAVAPTKILWVDNSSSLTGGGDGVLNFGFGRNRNYTRYAMMNIYSSDSTVWYKIPINQYGEQDEPK